MGKENVTLKELENMAQDAKALTPKSRRNPERPHLTDEDVKKGIEEVETLAAQAKGSTFQSEKIIETPEKVVERLRMAFSDSYDCGKLFRDCENAVLAALTTPPNEITDDTEIDLPKYYWQIEDIDRRSNTNYLQKFEQTLAAEGVGFRKTRGAGNKEVLQFWKIRKMPEVNWNPTSSRDKQR